MTTRPYHHGNLSRALLDEAVELARSAGSDAVVLREVARRAGVTASAAYRHYADRDALLAAVARIARERLGDALVDGREAAPRLRDPARRALAALHAIGAAYVRFGVDEPNLLAVAFLPLPPPPGADSPDAYAVLIGALDELVRVGELDAAHRDDAALLCWTAVHGLAQLTSIGVLAAASPAAPADVGSVEGLIEHVWTGLAGALAAFRPATHRGGTPAGRAPARSSARPAARPAAGPATGR